MQWTMDTTAWAAEQRAAFTKGRSPPPTGAFDFELYEVEYDAAAWKDGDCEERVPFVMHMHGRTVHGHSVSMEVEGVTQTVYLHTTDTAVSDSDLGMLYEELVKRASASRSGMVRANFAIKSMKVVRKPWFYGFAPDTMYVEIVCANPATVRGVHNACYRAFTTPGGSELNFQTFETRVDPATNFLIQKNLSAMRYVHVAQYTPSEVFYSDISGVCSMDAISLVTNDMPPSPLHEVSIDIECHSGDGKSFPDAERTDDVIIGVAATVAVGGELSVTHYFTQKRSDPVDGVIIHDCLTEANILVLLRAFIVEVVQADVLLHFNGFKFDMQYLWDRARMHKVLPMFSQLSRERGKKVTAYSHTLESCAYSKNVWFIVPMPGRIQTDVMVDIKRNYNLRSYSLNACSAKWLGDAKEDLPPKELFRLYEEGSPAAIATIASYCAKDTSLPWRLSQRLHLVVNTLMMAKITQVPPSWLLLRGQQIKVFTQLVSAARRRGIPVPDKVPVPDEGKYEGATVLEPKVGFYKEVITTLDFASLYPSIMIAENLCYTTIALSRGAAAAARTIETYDTPGGSVAVTSDRKGLLPEVLEELLSNRRAMKKKMLEETDPRLRAVYDATQLALKVSCNSVYGFTGVLHGMLPMRQIAATVTYVGRKMIHDTKAFVEKEYPKSEVIYGDTDSVMVLFRNSETGASLTLEESFKIGYEVEKRATAVLFKPPNKLEMEKCYKPYVLFSKKRYMAKMFENPRDLNDYSIDIKGIASKRRDFCEYVVDTLKAVQNALLVDEDVQKAVKTGFERAKQLVDGQVDMRVITLSKNLSKHESEYADSVVHAAVVKRMKLRDASSAPSSGDRIEFVMIQPKGGCGGKKKRLQSECADDPKYVAEHGIPIDYEWYWEHQLSVPLSTLFEFSSAQAQAQWLYAIKTHMEAKTQRSVSSMFGGALTMRRNQQSVDTDEPPLKFLLRKIK